MSELVDLRPIGTLNFIYPVLAQVEQFENGDFVASTPVFKLSSLAKGREESLNGLRCVIVSDYNNYLGDYPDGLTGDAKDLLRLYYAFQGFDFPVVRSSHPSHQVPSNKIPPATEKQCTVRRFEGWW